MPVFGGYRTMWVIVMFDLPTVTPEEKSCYRQFHDFLLADGFDRMQYSVYIRHCASEDNALVHMARVRAALPDEGEVRMICITDKQFGRIQVYGGRLRREPESPPQQVEIF